MKELDRRLKFLGGAEVDRDLSDLEAAVWARIDRPPRFPAMPRRAAAGLCAAAAFLAFALGTTAGMAHARQESGVFAIRAPLAPSTILSGRAR